MDVSGHVQTHTTGAPRPVVSVVMPAFNCAPYVDAALDSLARQTFQGWECVCVDDGSTDETALRLDAWGARDARIRVFQQPNAGVSAARNSGMEYARGDFLFFLDADDLLHPAALERLVRVARAETADVVVGGLVMIDANSTGLPTGSSHHAAVTVFDAPVMPSLLSYRLLRFEACGKLYSRQSIAAVTFPVGIACAEDTFFSLSAAARARRIAVCPEPLYGYRRVPTSASLSITSGRKYVAGSVAVAIHCHELCVQQKVPRSTANRLIAMYGTNRIMTEVMRAAADSAVTTAGYRQLRSAAVAGMRVVRGRTGRGVGVIAPQHRLSWLFMAVAPSRAILSCLWQLRTLRQALGSALLPRRTRLEPP
jgi:hypothetical protein